MPRINFMVKDLMAMDWVTRHERLAFFRTWSPLKAREIDEMMPPDLLLTGKCTSTTFHGQIALPLPDKRRWTKQTDIRQYFSVAKKPRRG